MKKQVLHINRILLISSLALMLVCLLSADKIIAHSALDNPCSNCHLCDSPTVEEPCLRSCIREDHNHNETHKISEGPDLIILDIKGDLYEPVPFDHKGHASMGDMSIGCVSCHHYSPEGQIPPCSDCHLEPKTLGMPGLKGAYHRQCLDCHTEWSHTTKCANCHLPKEKSYMHVEADDNSSMEIDKIMPVSLPSKKVYTLAKADVGNKVTFYHNEHTELFGLECTDCHQEENCSYCHDQTQTVSFVKTEEEVHAICNNCHQQDNCTKCHGTQEKPEFHHDPDKWRLSEYHVDLECSSCHTKSQNRITKMTAECDNCHDSWNQENFNHELVGLSLDEFHGELGCIDCHNNNQFHSKPNCENCHEDNRTPRKNPPGRYITNKVTSVSYLSTKEVP